MFLHTMQLKPFPSLLLATLCVGILTPNSFAQKVRTTLVTGGLSSPLYVTSPPNDHDRLFIVEQNTGRIRIFANGSILGTPFLDVGSISSSGGERGLLGLAFHQDYDNNGYFYINYTDNGGDTVVARYTVSANPDVADAASAMTVITATQPFSNHNGGHLAFSPIDGYLYIGLGDGGSGGDPGDRAQNGFNFKGKMLRIDVDSASPYAVPNDNPFVNNGSFRDEIWAYGLRNPWRYSFDRESGDLWIADVGQDVIEEISYQPASSAGGENYGWRLMEGSNCFNPPVNCNNGTLVLPIQEYTHGGNPFRCSITGGYVYRGSAIPGAQGTYFYADFCSNQVWSMRFENGVVLDDVERTAEISGGVNNISSFGEDAAGEMYIVDGSSGNGQIWKIEPDLFDISVTPLMGGQSATLTVSNASSNTTIYVAGSFLGTQVTRIPQLGVAVALEAPMLLGTTNTNGSGSATLTATVPSVTSGRTIFIQAAESGNVSNLLEETIL